MLRPPNLTRWLTMIAVLGSFAAASGGSESVFDKSPEGHALIVVDARIWRKVLLSSNDARLSSGGLTLRNPGAPGSSSEPTSRAVAGVLPFVVEPGRYRPSYVRAVVRRMQAGTGTEELRIDLPTDSLAEIARTVEAGTIVYVGRIDVRMVPRPFKENEYRIGFAYDRGRERQVWETLLAKGKPGLWESAIRARIAGLSAVSDTLVQPRSVPEDR